MASITNSTTSQRMNTNNGYAWTPKMEMILRIIRNESNILSEYHNYKYTVYKGRLRFFRVPIIILSAVNAFTAVGLQSYLQQELISVINSVLSLICGIITSLELFLNVQKKMENELLSHKDFYHLSLEIFKTITLEPEKRNIDGKAFLDDKFSLFQQLIQNSIVIDIKLLPNINRIEDELRRIELLNMENENVINNFNDTTSSVSNKKETCSPTSPTKENNKRNSFQSFSKIMGESCNQLVNPKYANLVKNRENTNTSYDNLIKSYSDIEKKKSYESQTHSILKNKLQDLEELYIIHSAPVENNGINNNNAPESPDYTKVNIPNIKFHNADVGRIARGSSFNYGKSGGGGRGVFHNNSFRFHLDTESVAEVDEMEEPNNIYIKSNDNYDGNIQKDNDNSKNV